MKPPGQAAQSLNRHRRSQHSGENHCVGQKITQMRLDSGLNQTGDPLLHAVKFQGNPAEEPEKSHNSPAESPHFSI